MSNSTSSAGPESAADHPFRVFREPVSNNLLRVHFGPRLRIPDVDGISLLEAAVAYAEAGWFVLPTSESDVKNPGSIVGGKWHKQSSRDPDVIRGWWEQHRNIGGIALHAGRSGAVVFDLDVGELARVPQRFREALRHARFQHSRQTGDRGHYLYAVADGETFGNGAGPFSPYGEVRGKNGVIVVAPTPHPEPGGEYRWAERGEVPPLPDVLRACLREAGNEAAPLVPEELDAFYAEHTGNDRPEALEGVLTVFAQDAMNSRHEALRNSLCMAFREARVGCYPAKEAADQLKAAFLAAFDGVPGRRPDPDEFARTAKWAAAQSLQAEPDEILARLDRNDPLLRVVDEDEFWSARPVLADLQTFARARLVSPWGMFGAVLARVLTTIPPRVVLPSIVGSEAPLNSFFALVGPSGLGKGTAESAASDFLDTADEVFTAPAGTGEGVVKLFACRTKATDPQMNLRRAVLLSVDEVDGFTAQASRTGGTFLPTMKTAWSGGRLGFAYADATKALRVMKHRYRLTMVIGVQPERAGFIFADGDGGTPQRFVWLPTDDPDAPDERPIEPPIRELPRWPDPARNRQIKFTSNALLLDLPMPKSDLEVVGVPESVVREVEDNRRTALRTGGNVGLDGHALLARLKVATGLMWLDGRVDKITDEDWTLAGIVMAISDRTRARTQTALGAKAKAVNRQRGLAEGERETTKAEVIEDAKIQRAVKNVHRHLMRVKRLSRKDGRKLLRADIRDQFDEAADRLVDAGIATREPGEQESYTLVLVEDQ